MSEEEEGSVISVEELTEKGITDRGVSWGRRYQTRKGWISIETATQGQRDCRRKRATESLKETKKRISDEGGASPKRRKSRRAEPLVDFLRGKAATYREIRQQEIHAKQQEQARKSAANDESYDPTTATNEYCILTVVKKLLDK